jgi:transcription factor 1
VTTVTALTKPITDDIIKYLAPTLEPYKGCTIIDVNPGVCLWSSKLHDFLQPKRHILMEPDEDYVEPFIKPLLEAPGSTYRHTTMTGAHPRSYWSNYATLFTDGKLMDPRPSRAPDDPKLNEIDYSLLVTGNLSRRARNVLTLGRVRHAELILQHMFWAGLARDLMHNRGPVRMLWWTSDVVKSYLMQRNMCGMVSFNCAASVCASVTPVVECVTGVNEYLNGPGLAPPRQLTPSMVGLSRRHAEERLAALGMTVPEDRPVVHPEVNVTDDGEEFVFPGRLDCESIDDLADAVDLVESRWHRFSTAAANGVGVGSSNQRLVAFRELAAAIQHPQVKAMVFGAAAIYPTGNDYKNKFGRIRAMLYSDSFLAVFHLEANYKNLEERLQAEHGAAGDDGALARRLGGLRERILALGESVHDSSPLLYDRYHHITEDQIAMFAAPPRGVPHKRRYPSLEASPGDALPAKAMTLLDVVPRTADYRVAGLASRGEVCAATHELIKALFHSRSRPFLQALEQIAPGAVQDLLPSLPTLADPRRGGRLNPHRVVVRQLTDEMIDELMQAWFEWPFRPSYGTISCGSREGEASGMHESGAEEDDGFD